MCVCTITSRTKINVLFCIFLQFGSLQGTLHSKFFQKMLILAFQCIILPKWDFFPRVNRAFHRCFFRTQSMREGYANITIHSGKSIGPNGMHLDIQGPDLGQKLNAIINKKKLIMISNLFQHKTPQGITYRYIKSKNGGTLAAAALHISIPSIQFLLGF